MAYIKESSASSQIKKKNFTRWGRGGVGGGGNMCMSEFYLLKKHSYTQTNHFYEIVYFRSV